MSWSDHPSGDNLLSRSAECTEVEKMQEFILIKLTIEPATIL
jgi:hypothetical protein